VDLTELAETVAAADDVVAVGGRTHWEVGGCASPAAVEVEAPTGIVTYDPADLTVTVAAGTTVRELAAVLAAAGQECALDPRDDTATVGGVLATGLSGHRRLRDGPLRDRVLEVRFVTADGRVVRGGGPTVKNVTGFDIPRLLVGSLGTVGVLVDVILRCQPLPTCTEWSTTGDDPFATRARMYRPSCVAWDGARTHLLLEGDPGDVDAERRAAGARPVDAPPPWPAGPHRGRISIPPGRLRALAPSLEATGARWLAEVGVGTVHVACDDPATLGDARAVAAAHGGWLLREAGAPGLDGFGRPLPNAALMQRIRDAYDPTGKLGRGRLPLDPHPPVEVEDDGPSESDGARVGAGRTTRDV
jgi:glycolate oxidase FAD binding subunit